jgi:hypothetical protein
MAAPTFKTTLGNVESVVSYLAGQNRGENHMWIHKNKKVAQRKIDMTALSKMQDMQNFKQSSMDTCEARIKVILAELLPLSAEDRSNFQLDLGHYFKIEAAELSLRHADLLDYKVGILILLCDLVDEWKRRPRNENDLIAGETFGDEPADLGNFATPSDAATEKATAGRQLIDRSNRGDKPTRKKKRAGPLDGNAQVQDEQLIRRPKHGEESEEDNFHDERGGDYSLREVQYAPVTDKKGKKERGGTNLGESQMAVIPVGGGGAMTTPSYQGTSIQGTINDLMGYLKQPIPVPAAAPPAQESVELINAKIELEKIKLETMKAQLRLNQFGK